MAVEGLEPGRELVVAGLLADQDQQFTDGTVDHGPQLPFGLRRGPHWPGRRGALQMERADGTFDHALGDFAPLSFGDSGFPGQGSLVRGQPNQGPDLGLMFGFGLLTIRLMPFGNSR